MSVSPNMMHVDRKFSIDTRHLGADIWARGNLGAVSYGREDIRAQCHLGASTIGREIRAHAFLINFSLVFLN